MAALLRILLVCSVSLLLVCPAARAIPPDRVVQMEPGSDKFEKGYPGGWQAFSLDPEVVKAQTFKAAEVHLTAGRAGDTLLMLVHRSLGQAIVWQVKVSPQQPPARAVELSEIHPSCACKMKDGNLECSVPGPKCLASLRTSLNNCDLTGQQLRLRYSVEGLQALLRDLLKRLQAQGVTGVDLAFSGANLRLIGRVPDEETWRKVVFICYEGMVGRMMLDDKLKVGGGGL